MLRFNSLCRVALAISMLFASDEAARAQVEGRPVAAAEIREKIVGATFDWSSDGGGGGTLILKPDGRIEFRTRTGARQLKLDRGTWKIAGDRVCTAYPRHGKGPERCFYLVRNGDGSYAYYEDGRLDGRMTRR